MSQDLIVKQETNLTLSKSNSLIKITNKILANRSTALATALRYKPFVQIGHTGDITSVAFSPDGKTALSGSRDSTLKLWDIAIGKEIRTFNGHTDEVSYVAFSPDGKTALSVSNDKTLKLWDIITGKIILTYDRDRISFFVISHDWKMILMSSEDNTLKLLDASTGEEIVIFDAKNLMYGGVRKATFSPDGKTILSIGYSRVDVNYDTYPAIKTFSGSTINLWDISTGKVIRTFEGNTDEVSSVVFSPDGKTALSGGIGSDLILWDISTGKVIRTLGSELDADCSELDKLVFSLGQKQYGFRFVRFSPDENMAVSICWKETTYYDDYYDDNYVENTILVGSIVYLWDISTGKLIESFSDFSEQITSIAFSPDGKTLLSRGWRRDDYDRDSSTQSWVNHGPVDIVKLLNVSTGEAILNMKWPSSEVSSIMFSRDWKTVLVASSDKSIKLLDSNSNKLIRTFESYANYVTSIIAFSPDGKMALSGSSSLTNYMLTLWDIYTGRVVRRFKGHTDDVNSFAFSPDGEKILSGSKDKTLKLWDTSAGEVVRTFEGHTSFVSSVTFSPDGKTALSGSHDSTLKLWDISTGKEIRTFKGHANVVKSVAFSPDGKTALSGSHDRTLKLWDISTGKEIRIFEGHTDGVSSVIFSPDGKTALSGSHDNTIKLWDIGTGKEIRIFEGHTNVVKSVAFSPDGKTALSGSFDNTLKLWDVVTGKEIRTMIILKDGEWVTITPEGYFDHSENGRQYLNVLTSPMSAIAIDDVTYNHYYRPNELSNSDAFKSNFPEIDINEDEIPF